MFLNCDENFMNSECRFIAIVADVSTMESELCITLVIVMMIIEMSELFVGFVITTISILVFMSPSGIHTNFARIAIRLSAHFYVLMGSRIVLLIFESAILKFDAENVSTIVFIASIAHIHEIIFFPILFVGFILERLFATIHIADYEIHKRSYISTMVTIITVLSSVLSSVAVSFGIVYDVLTTVAVMGGLIFVLLSFGMTTMITIAVSCGAACALGFISVFLHLYYSSQKDENLSSLYGQSFNVVHTIAVPINVGLVVYSMPAWKNNVQLNLHGWFPFIPSPSTMEVVRVIGVSDTYFKDLLGSWEIKNTADKNRK